MKRIQVNSNEMQLLFICKKIDLFATLIDHCSITERLVITDYGNLQYAVDEELLQQQRQHYHHIRNYADFMACNLALIKQVQLMLKQNEKFLTIGGDHAIGFGMSSNQFKCVFSLIVVVVVVIVGGGCRFRGGSLAAHARSVAGVDRCACGHQFAQYLAVGQHSRHARLVFAATVARHLATYGRR